jgi:adenylate cyclase class IV
MKLPGISFAGKKYEKTTMFDNTLGLMQNEDARLRVKQISDQKDDKEFNIEFSYKRRIKAIGGIKEEEEIETFFTTNIDSFFHILNKMGYTATTSYERYRETYNTSDLKITLDKFPFGYVLEIEGPKKDINDTCVFLKLDAKNSYPLSCDDVYTDLCKKKNILPKNHILFGDSRMPQIE